MAWIRTMSLTDRRRSSSSYNNHNVHPYRNRNNIAEQQLWPGSRDNTPVRERAVVHRRFPNSIQQCHNNNTTTEGHVLIEQQQPHQQRPESRRRLVRRLLCDGHSRKQQHHRRCPGNNNNITSKCN
jgi:hypothetical protein